MRFRKKFFPVRMMRPWYGVPREVGIAHGSPEVSRVRLDRAWTSLG